MSPDYSAMVTNREQKKQVIKKICDQVLDGSLNIEEFHRRWPPLSDDEPLFAAIHDDLENAVEHAPGYWFKRGINQKTWQNSDLYKIVFLDSVLLTREESHEDLLRCRNLLAKNVPFSRELIEKELMYCLESGSQRSSGSG